jgi:hypothetical protein
MSALLPMRGLSTGNCSMWYTHQKTVNDEHCCSRAHKSVAVSPDAQRGMKTWIEDDVVVGEQVLWLT